MRNSAEDDRIAMERLQQFRDEVAKIDVTTFSPRVQAIIAEYEQTVAAERLARETDVERFKRLHPHLSDEGCIALALCACLGKRRPIGGR
jgi:hypothetical protein